MARVSKRKSKTLEFKSKSAKEMFDLIEEVKKANDAGLLNIVRISPADNYIQFQLGTNDKKKIKKVCDSLLQRYTSLHFMWNKTPEGSVAGVVYYYET